MTKHPKFSQLGPMLRTRRRNMRLSLRDLAAEIGVSLNTLSRVERGYVPNLNNFQRIVDWLGVPADSFLEAQADPASTPEAIARHLRSDRRLSPEAATRIGEIVEEMYCKLTDALLAEILHDMQTNIERPPGPALRRTAWSAPGAGLPSRWPLAPRRSSDDR